MADLISLKDKWELKFGDSQAQPLKSIAERQATPLGSVYARFGCQDDRVLMNTWTQFGLNQCLVIRGHPIHLPNFFVGNIPIKTVNSEFHDSIAEAFHQSSRKELRYIPPTMQLGEIVVRPSPEIVENGSKRWNMTAVGYFLGRKPYFHHLEAFAKKTWKSLIRVTATVNGFFFFQFTSTAAMEEVIEGGPWLFQGQPIVLQRWEPGMSLRKQKHTQIPVWIRLKHLPMEYWTSEGLSVVASGVGKPLYSDAVTKQ
ncbi:UNVERIFIED_CONTAM: hypothetical protein Sradi_7118100 [Sesamum radiatum]|uniref:DUF4283 domain-containing protein n=1 Tax=Sesamum radiatum TaxID=300843 RepID=A0AAW2J169_SESRA